MTPRVSIIVLLLACACDGSRPAPDTARELETITFEMVKKEKTFENCVAGAEDCAYVRFDYPVIIDAPAGTAIEPVSRTVQDFLLRPLNEDEATTTMTALMDRFIFDFTSFRQDVPDSSQVWFLERKVLVQYNSPDVVSLSLTERSYTGGAHANESIHFANLDPKTGAPITLSDWLEPGSEEELTRIAEERFRSVRGIEEGVSLTDAGFTFEDGKFRLSDNVAIGEDALIFYYNPYEVAPYSMGATELTIPYETIPELVARRRLPESETPPP